MNIYNSKEVEKVEVLLTNARILAHNEEKYCPTVGGLLIFGSKPQDFLFQSGIIFARINGSNIYDDIIDSKQLEGRLPELIEQCLTLFRLYNQKKSTFLHGRRFDKEDYLEIVFRELIVNAICHRKYSITGSRIRVIIQNDRYEIRSPGRLPNTITIENVKMGACFLKNQLLFKFLNHYGFIENLGRGIPLSIGETLKHTGKQIDLVEEGEEFVVRVFKSDP